MQTTIQAKLKSLHYGPTRYELVLTDGARSFLLLYTTRKSMRGLVAAAKQRIEALRAILGEDFVLEQGKGMTGVCGAWTVKFSGRTQRDCVTNGELPFASNVGAR